MKKRERKRIKRALMAVPRSGLTSFPENRRVKLKYHTTGSFSCAVGAVGSYIFRLNSAYDPDYTGAGHQPMGFDQWATFYRSYIVEKAKYHIELLNYSAFQGILGVVLDNDATISTDLDTICEQPVAASKLQLAQNPPYLPPATFEGTVSMSQWFNVSDVRDEVARFGATISADPTNVCFLALFGRDLAAAGTVTVYYNMILEQTIVFSEPAQLPKS